MVESTARQSVVALEPLRSDAIAFSSAWGWCLGVKCLGVVGIWLPVWIFGGGVLGENLLLIEKPVYKQLPGAVVAELSLIHI